MKKIFLKLFIFSLISLSLFAASNISEAASCLEQESCMKPSDGIECVARGACPGSSTSDSNYQECCKSKTSSNTIQPGEEKMIFLGEPIETNSLKGFMQAALAVSDWILGIVGSLSLLMFIYGGVMFIISGGSSQRVEQGKQIIIGSIIGLTIVFASYTIIRFVFTAAGLDWKGTSEFKDITPTQKK